MGEALNRHNTIARLLSASKLFSGAEFNGWL